MTQDVQSGTHVERGPWTLFWDMHSGGGQKLEWSKIYIQAPEDEAKSVFYSMFGRNPERVTCTCCGKDYAIHGDEVTFARASGYHRNCDNLETPRDEDGRYKAPDDPWFEEHYYLEDGEQEDARKRGYEVRENISNKYGKSYLTVEEYLSDPNVKVVYASEIEPEWRTAPVPEEGYVWAD